jgi:hypothetical protein
MILKDKNGRSYVLIGSNTYYTDTYYYIAGTSIALIVDKITGELIIV